MADIPQTFRTSKIQKFIAEKVRFMEIQQRTIETFKSIGTVNEVKEAITVLEASQTAIYTTILDLCKEFNLEMPIVLGVDG